MRNSATLNNVQREKQQHEGRRTRLIELINKSKEDYLNKPVECSETEYIVDSLLDKGAILPPCALGSKVYRITYSFTNGKRMEHISGPIQIVGFHLGVFPTIRGHKRKNYLIGYYDNFLMHLDIDEIGNSIFFNEEDAKNKMKEKNSAE